MLVEPGHFVLQEVPIPEPGPAEVILKVERVGICGSDVHIYHGLSPRTKPPLVLGHEFSGTIHSIGTEVKHFRVGDRVTAEPLIECGECTYCQSGRYNLCPELYTIGSRLDHDGAYADYVRVPERKLIALPDNMSFAEGAMVELVACAIHTQDVANIASGDVALVIGAGSLGLLVAQATKMAGADVIAVADVVPGRLALAEQLGADMTVNAAETDLVSWAKETYGEGGINRVFDTASVPETFRQTLQVVRRGGRVINMGVATQTVEWQPNILLLKEIELTGMNMYTRPDFEKALEAMNNGHIRVEPLITTSYPLAQIDEAYDRVLHDPDRCKVMLGPADGISI
jgi:L-iditol 2-dehydrogenase